MRPSTSSSLGALAFSALLVSVTTAMTENQASPDDTQYCHERYHGLLSMASYGDYEVLCPQQTFTQASLLKAYPNSTEQPWTLLQQWGPTASGVSGFIVQIPEMDKVVMVFGGMYGWQNLNMTPTPIADVLNLGEACANCTAHAGALQAYLEAKEATTDWIVVKEQVNLTGHQWSVTGHGLGGMISQIAALDLGWRGLAHWSHSHGAPPVFNAPAATLYNSLFEGEASQRTVANNDSMPTVIEQSYDYTFVLSGFHVYGVNTTYGMNYENCWDDSYDPVCAGGDNLLDHYFYYTPVGQCGGDMATYNETLQEAFLSSQSSMYYETATFLPNATTGVYTQYATPGPTSAPPASSTGKGAHSNGSTTSATAATVTVGTGALALSAAVGLAVAVAL